jgi:cephalosporin-C deacetylase
MYRPHARATTALCFLFLSLGAAQLCPAQELVLTPFKPGGIYALGDKAGWDVSLVSDGAHHSDYEYTIRRNNFDLIQSGKLDLTRPATIAVTLDEPAMLYVEVRSTDPAARVYIVGAAIAPDKLQPVAPRPKDFDQFWADKIKLLEQVAPNPKLTRKDSGREDIEYCTLQLDHINGKHVHGQLARPSKEGKYPGLVIFQWAAPPYPLQKEWVTERAAEGWLALNIEPHDVLPDQPKAYYDELPAELKQYQAIGRDDRDQNYFLQMYLADYRAVEYLASRPDWDGRTLIATGISMGGQQSMCVAALNPKVTGIVVHVPAGADSNGPLHGRASGFPFWPADDPKAMRTALYFDTVNCAPRIRVPALVSMGFRDTVTPPVGIWTAFNQIPGPKEAVPLVDAAHNHQSTPEQQAPYLQRAAEWMKTLVAGGSVIEPARER